MHKWRHAPTADICQGHHRALSKLGIKVKKNGGPNYIFGFVVGGGVTSHKLTILLKISWETATCCEFLEWIVHLSGWSYEKLRGFSFEPFLEKLGVEINQHYACHEIVCFNLLYIWLLVELGIIFILFFLIIEILEQNFHKLLLNQVLNK